jgi:hypothetical protein
MADPAVSIFAKIELLRGKFQQQLKDELKEMQQQLKTTKTEPISLQFQIAPDTQAKLNAALLKIKIPTLTVPVNFVTTGMPGVPAGMMMAGLTGAGGALPPLPPGMAVAQAALANANGGGGSSGKGFFNYSPRGFGRYIGPAILLREAFRSVQQYQKYGTEMDRAEIMHDERAKFAAEEGFQNSIGGFPVVGQAAQVLANQIGDKRGTDRIMAQSDASDRKSKAGKSASDIYTHYKEETLGIGRSDEDSKTAAIARGRQLLEEAISKAIEGVPAADRPDKAIKQARAAYERYAGAALSFQHREEDFKMHDLSNDRDIISAKLEGDTDRAARLGLSAKQDDHEHQLRLKDGALADKYRAEVAPKETEELEDEIRRRREKAAGDSAARIKDMEKAADDKMLHAKGEVYAAMESIIKHSADAHVAALNREADAEKDATTKTQLRTEAIAVQAAGIRELANMKIQAQREADRDTRGAQEDIGNATMQNRGQFTGARRKTVQDKYEDDAEDVLRLKLPPEIEKQRLEALEAHRDAGMLRIQTDQDRDNRGILIETEDASAHARGQEGVGDMLRLKEHIEEMSRDAGDDPTQQKIVSNFRDAKVAELRRRMRPQSRVFGLPEYHDALQSSITRSQGNQEALKLLQDISNKAVNGGGAAGVGGAGGAAGAMQAQTSAIQDLANQVRRAKNIAVIGK